MKYIVLIITLSFTLFLISTTNNPVTASIQVDNKHYITSDTIKNPKLEKINEQEEYLFVVSSNGLSLINSETFKVEKSLNVFGEVTDYEMIDNIEDESSPNKDILIFIKDKEMPTVIAYSLDSLEPIWSYTSKLTGYNDAGVTVTSKIPMFDYIIQDKSLIMVAGYQLYHIGLIDGQLNWTYAHDNNIWGVVAINDITGDATVDLAISVQPTQVMTIDASTGSVLWSKHIAKPYDVIKNNKLIGSVNRNVWDLHYNNNKIVATSEDGTLYQLNPDDGTIYNSVLINEDIPNMFADSVYLKGDIPIKSSGLGTNGLSAYKIMNTRLINDISGDGVDDFLVTVYEDNPFASYQFMNTLLFLIDGQSLAILSKQELPANRKIVDLRINNNQLTFFDLNNYNLIDLDAADLTLVRELNIPLDEHSHNQQDQTMTSFYDGETFYLKMDSFYQFDVTDPDNPTLLNTIYLLNKYHTIYDEDYLYKLYYRDDPDNNKKSDYYMIESIDIKTQAVLLEHALDENDFLEFDGFNHYIINENKQGVRQLIYLTDQELVVLSGEEELVVSRYSTDAFQPDDLNVDFDIIQFSNYKDINNDGLFELLIVTKQGDFIILNGSNLTDVLHHMYIHTNYYYQETAMTDKMVEMVVPSYNEDGHFIYLINNHSIQIATLNNNFEITETEEIELTDYNFWNDPSNVFHEYDYDGDGIKDVVLKLSHNDGGDEQKLAILYSGSNQVGFVSSGWNFMLYPTNEDMNETGTSDLIMVTGGQDEDDNWYQRASLINPSFDYNTSETVIFERLFYEGNNFTMNSNYKPLQVINDTNGDGEKDIAILIDRWGQSYLQVYAISQPDLVIESIPITVENIEQETMYNSKAGAPGGIIQIIHDNGKEYVMINIINRDQSSYTTMLYRMHDSRLEFMDKVAEISGSVYQYDIFNDYFVTTTYVSNNRNDMEFSAQVIDLNNQIEFDHIKDGDKLTTSYATVSWKIVTNHAFNPMYKVYVNGILVAVTSERTSSLYLAEGKNTIGVGVMLGNGTETISNIVVTVDSKDAFPPYIYYYFVATLLVVFIAPRKFKRYKRRGKISE